MAFTPCLQYQYASGKNTSDIALALDAQGALFDERGATVLIVGEAKTPDALQNASDQFFMWQAAEVVPAGDGGAKAKPAAQVPTFLVRRLKSSIRASSFSSSATSRNAHNKI